MSTASWHYLGAAAGHTHLLKYVVLLCFDSRCRSMWCPLDTIPAPDAEETQGALRFRHIRPVIVFLLLCRILIQLPPSLPLYLAEHNPKLSFSLLDGTFDENERFVL